MIRIPALERACNFRDFGGYPARGGRRVRWRRLFRSGVMAQLSAADCASVAGYGVRLVCDLRRPDERATRPNPDFGAGVRQASWRLPQEGAFLRGGSLVQMAHQEGVGQADQCVQHLLADSR